MRLYGPTVGNGSFAVVTRGFRFALDELKLLSGVIPTDAYNDHGFYAGAMDPWGMLCGHIGGVQLMSKRGRHGRRVAMVAPNSTAIHQTVLQTLREFCTDLLTPSEWGKEMLLANFGKLGGFCPPIQVVPHGVLPGFGLPPSEYVKPNGKIRILHMASSGIDRKGTYELVEGFSKWKYRSDCDLNIVLGPQSIPIVKAKIADICKGNLPDNIRIVSQFNAEPQRLREAYWLHDLVCQPSRSEGFGMVPMEALACGVPVVATNCTGHQQWYRTVRPACVPILHGALDTVSDAPGVYTAQAPTVAPEMISWALTQAMERLIELQQAARLVSEHIYDTWSWTNQLRPWLEAEGVT